MFWHRGKKKHQAIDAEERNRSGSINLDCESLLGRAPRSVNLNVTKELISGRTVLVTGAGGTIGSELCRQIAALDPKQLILADNGEFNLYSIERELSEDGYKDILVPQLIDVCQRDHVYGLFKRYRPHVVLQAELHARFQSAGLAMRYYTPDLHVGAFALPADIQALIA